MKHYAYSLIFMAFAMMKHHDANAAASSFPFLNKYHGWISLPQKRHADTNTPRGSGSSIEIAQEKNQLLTDIIPRGGASSSIGNDSGTNESNEETKQLVIVIDVDNTLYSERDLLSSSSSSSVWKQGIESQIIRNTHLFGLNHFNLTSDQCDELYKKHGSTVEGLRHLLRSGDLVGNEEIILARFYKEVYDAIDFRCLYGLDHDDGVDNKIDYDNSQGGSDNVRSGYDHGHALQKRRALAEFLKSICDAHPVYLASNSPKGHVERVLNGMGLRGVKFAGILSPDSDYCYLKAEKEDNGEANIICFPTKNLPRQFFKHVSDRHPIQSNRIILLDDSLHNIQKAETIGFQGIHINGQSASNNYSARTLEEGLAEALGHILPPNSVDISDEGSNADSSCESKELSPQTSSFTFSDVKYLRAKNKVDINSIDPHVWEQLARQLSSRILQKGDGVLRLADLGAGMLSMMELVILGGGNGDREKPSLFSLILDFLKSNYGNGDDAAPAFTKVEYYAYESNLSLLEGCRERLQKLGFEEDGSSLENGLLFKREFKHQPLPTDNADGMPISPMNIEMIIHLRPMDFQNDQDPPNALDLIIGCCFADLFDPDQLALALSRFARVSDSRNLTKLSPLVYFPITFAGITQFSPSLPLESSESSRCQWIPSDTTAFRVYSESLSGHGHNLDPSRIVDAIRNHGGSLIAQKSSDWNIHPDVDGYLWATMIYFFGMSGAREMTKHHLDAAGWIKRSRFYRRPIIVSNVDLLFHLIDNNVETASKGVDGTNNNSANVSMQEIQFVSPYNVTTITKVWDTKNPNHLSPDQVEIETACSLISSGTELKIFKGSFESAALDVNIKGMADETMQYPLAYGYSLVGRVVACGSKVEDAESLIGRLVFAFCPHATRVITTRDAIQLVPDGIDAEDAVFMPSVETALSMVHDAHVRIGENVAVFGQGLIGLLVTSILSMQSPSLISTCHPFCSITAFDTFDDRLRISSSLGATNALKPNSASSAGPFDVCIEASGNPRALQSAIDNTSNNGRIIVGSWYGNSDVSLKLGIDFHRSHKTIQTSQVSNIPPQLMGLWSKERRFALTWALVKSLRPSGLITKRLPLNDAQVAYELLDRGKEIAICFKYDEL